MIKHMADGEEVALYLLFRAKRQRGSGGVNGLERCGEAIRFRPGVRLKRDISKSPPRLIFLDKKF